MWIAIVIGAVLLLLVVGVVLLMRTPGGRFPIGSRAFEAELTLTALRPTIEARKQELAAATDPRRRKRLEFEIQFLSRQEIELQGVVDARDVSPGRGYIGFDPAPPETPEG